MSPTFSTPQCGRGWSKRCAASHSKKCRCRCGGANHGAALRDRETGIPNGCHARFRVEHFSPERIVIRDLGPWSQHMTVTNDAEWVIEKLSPAPLQRVYYYDSEGQLDELLHRNQRFVGFAPGDRVGMTADQLVGWGPFEAAR